jgi:hypothetical protein
MDDSEVRATQAWPEGVGVAFTLCTLRYSCRDHTYDASLPHKSTYAARCLAGQADAHEFSFHSIVSNWHERRRRQSSMLRSDRALQSRLALICHRSLACSTTSSAFAGLTEMEEPPRSKRTTNRPDSTARSTTPMRPLCCVAPRSPVILTADPGAKSPPPTVALPTRRVRVLVGCAGKSPTLAAVLPPGSVSAAAAARPPLLPPPPPPTSPGGSCRSSCCSAALGSVSFSSSPCRAVAEHEEEASAM